VSGDVLTRIREASAEVARRARHVRIDEEGLARLAADLCQEPPPSDDPAHHRVGDDASTLAYVMTLDAVNFGSGWFPHLAKRPGMSGYFTIATSLRERFEREGPWTSEELAGLDAAACARVFGQDPECAEVAELMELFARSLRDLGEFLLAEYDGRFEGPVRAADGSAASLVELLARMPLYRDVSRYDGMEVPLFKRAQITAADLSKAFAGRGPGRFRDLDRLTLFADNLVPHVLRCEGALAYDPDLAGRIDAGLPIQAGSPEEVEIRAVAVHAVEWLVAALARTGAPTTAQGLDHRLWTRGHRPAFKARPRHRARTPYY